jgi:hypothetical protein
LPKESKEKKIQERPFRGEKKHGGSAAKKKVILFSFAVLREWTEKLFARPPTQIFWETKKKVQVGRNDSRAAAGGVIDI